MSVLRQLVDSELKANLLEWRETPKLIATMSLSEAFSVYDTLLDHYQRIVEFSQLSQEDSEWIEALVVVGCKLEHRILCGLHDNLATHNVRRARDAFSRREDLLSGRVFDHVPDIHKYLVNNQERLDVDLRDLRERAESYGEFVF